MAFLFRAFYFYPTHDFAIITKNYEFNFKLLMIKKIQKEEGFLGLKIKLTHVK